MENMDKMAKIPQNLSAQIVYPRPKVWGFNEKRLHYASVVRGFLGKHYQKFASKLKKNNKKHI